MRSVTIQFFRSYKEPHCLIDVRSPSEYAIGHIPGAINMPLFSDEQRSDIGTIYKGVGREAALLKGLDYVGSEMSHLVRRAHELAEGRSIFVHCWRGDKRSESVAWLLSFSGLEVHTIQGGYKAYRQFLAAEFMARNYEIKLLGGLTGSGKTTLLLEMKKHDFQIIDLEGLAHHKGSAFGDLGELPQPTNEQFSNALYESFLSFDPTKPIWLESESKNVGKVVLPDPVWNKMLDAGRVELVIPDAQRIRNLVDLYGEYSKSLLKKAFEKIQKRLGGLKTQLALSSIEENDLYTAAKIALSYYDKAYQKSKKKANHSIDFILEYDGVDHVHGVKLLKMATDKVKYSIDG